MPTTQALPNGLSRPAEHGVIAEAGLLEAALQPEVRSKLERTGAPEVPGYEMIDRLGSGSSGEVWLAEELETDRIVALKVLHLHGAADASAEMIQREVRMLGSLAHPNLVLLHRGIATTDGRQGFAMEWIDGWPLDEWLQAHPDLSLGDKLALFRGIVSGVAFLHNHGVIHRDLKPANLIVGAEGVAKIVDFGLARLHREGVATHSYGGSIGVSGTLHFMAPEQAANGDGARAMPVDVYSLGLILYRILTGEWLLSTEGTPAETLALVLHPPPLVLRGPARGLPGDLKSILRHALSPDPSGRYHHAGDLAADLDRFDSKQPVVARKHTLIYLTATLLRRQARRSVLAGCLVLAGLTVGGAIYHRQRKVAERNETNLRHAYALTSFTLGLLRDELRTTVPREEGRPKAAAGDLPGTGGGAAPELPLNAAGELDLRYYQALLADLRSATSEGHAKYESALKSIQPALDLYSKLALENPNDPKRLLDAARARLSFARMLERTGRTAAAGDEARKTLHQLDRLADCPGMEPVLLPPLRCDVLRLLAKDAHLAGDSVRAFDLAREMLAASAELPSGLLVQPENETAPRLALAAFDLATYAISAGPDQLAEAKRAIDRSTAVCRTAQEQAPQSSALTRGLGFCLLSKARLLLNEERWHELPPLFEEGGALLIGEQSSVRYSSFPLVREFSITATAWVGEVLDQPDAPTSNEAIMIARRFTNHLISNKNGSEDVMIQSAKIYLYASRLACHCQNRELAAYNATRAVRLLLSRQRDNPSQIDLALMTAMSLHQAHSLAELPAAEWNEGRGRHLNLLLRQLTERSNELNPEQQRELSALK